MDCPQCGLVNPAAAIVCGCGWDFAANAPSELPRINLAWRQKLAAYWAISWPAWVLSMSLPGFLTVGYTVDEALSRRIALEVITNVSFFVVQLLCTQRLVRKNFRSFRIEVLREDGQRYRRLSLSDSTLVWLWIMGPQLAFIL